MTKTFKTGKLIVLACALSSLGVLHAELTPIKQSTDVAQQRSKVTGTVEDALGSVAGASVIIKGSTNGVITDLNGNFTLEGVNKGQTIQVSFIGYISQEIKYEGQSSLRIVLVEDAQKISEVVVTARNELDERTFRQEYEASFESYEGLVARDFDRELNKSNETIKDDDTLIVGIDFNVNKMPCSISVLRGKDLHCLDFLFGSFNTEELMKAIQIKYPKHRKIFHTDASGSANKSSAGGQTDITIIRKFGYQVYNLTKNPNIIDRVNAFNGLIKSASGLRKYFVAPHLKKVVETLEKHVFDDNGLPNKKHEYHDDIYDALSYSAWHYSDLGKSQATKIKISGI